MTYSIKLPSRSVNFYGTSTYSESVNIDSFNHLLCVLRKIQPAINITNVIDIGANIGLTTLLIDDMIEEANVYSFEPHPDTFSQLKQNIAENGPTKNNVELINLALGKTNCMMSFRNSNRHNTGNSLLLENSLAERSQDSTTLQVKKLDDYFENEKIFEFIKIDVEGFELDVIEGGQSIIANTHVVLIEFNHWCLSSIAGILPDVALKRIFEIFKYVFYYDRKTKNYIKIITDNEKWNFLHNNMVNVNVDDLLCTNYNNVAKIFE